MEYVYFPAFITLAIISTASGENNKLYLIILTEAKIDNFDNISVAGFHFQKQKYESTVTELRVIMLCHISQSSMSFDVA